MGKAADTQLAPGSYQELPKKRLQRSPKGKESVRSNVRLGEQVGGDGRKVAEGPTGVDLQAEDGGARPGAVGQDAPQGRAGQKHPFRSQNLESWRGERK